MIPHTIKEVQINKFIYMEGTGRVGEGLASEACRGFPQIVYKLNAVVALNAYASKCTHLHYVKSSTGAIRYTNYTITTIEQNDNFFV